MDSIGDFLTIIRNGIMLGKSSVGASYSRLKYDIAGVLKDEGFIRDFQLQEDGIFKKVVVFLKYVDGESVIHEIVRKSKPSRRYFAKSNNIAPVIGKLGISILSTNKGVITDKQAKKLCVGGEVICTVW